MLQLGFQTSTIELIPQKMSSEPVLNARVGIPITTKMKNLKTLEEASVLAIPRTDALRDAGRLYDAALSGDAQAANAFYYALADCMTFSDDSETQKSSPTDCRNLTRRQARDKLGLLSAAAENGDPLAQYNFAVVAEQALPFLLAKQAQSAIDLRSRTIAQLESAAQSGLIDARVLLFQFLGSTRFGAYDGPRALANLLAAAESTGRADYASIAARFQGGLSPSEVEAGRRLASVLMR